MQFLVASAGGHANKLIRLRQDIDADTERGSWPTFDTVQGRALQCDGHEAAPGHGAITRNVAAAVRNYRFAIAQPGIGTAIAAMEGGGWPILVRRRGARGEHVDDYEVPLAR